MRTIECVPVNDSGMRALRVVHRQHALVGAFLLGQMVGHIAFLQQGVAGILFVVQQMQHTRARPRATAPLQYAQRVEPLGDRLRADALNAILESLPHGCRLLMTLNDHAMVMVFK